MERVNRLAYGPALGEAVGLERTQAAALDDLSGDLVHEFGRDVITRATLTEVRPADPLGTVRLATELMGLLLNHVGVYRPRGASDGRMKRP
jgi:hypothetical protein